MYGAITDTCRPHALSWTDLGVAWNRATPICSADYSGAQVKTPAHDDLRVERGDLREDAAGRPMPRTGRECSAVRHGQTPRFLKG
jgi:hypothetical protein